VKFSDVRPGSPAAKAGFKAGDVLVKFGDMPIHNLYDFTDALRRSKVGDVVDVKVMRDGKPVLKVDDVADMKVRVLESPIDVAEWTACGTTTAQKIWPHLKPLRATHD